MPGNLPAERDELTTASRDLVERLDLALESFRSDRPDLTGDEVRAALRELERRALPTATRSGWGIPAGLLGLGAVLMIMPPVAGLGGWLPFAFSAAGAALVVVAMALVAGRIVDRL